MTVSCLTEYRWNAQTGEEFWQLRAPHSPMAGIALSPDGTLLATINGDGTVRLWEVPQ